MEEFLFNNNNVFQVIDAIIYLFYIITAIYLIFFTIASLLSKRKEYPEAEKKEKIAVLLFIYNADYIPQNAIKSFLEQNYPSDKFHFFVIANKLSSFSLSELDRLQTEYITFNEVKTLSELLKNGVEYIDNIGYNFVVILDSDTKVAKDYLNKINNALYAGCDVIQTHKKDQEHHSLLGILNLISNEINNSIFRKGHCKISLSSALFGTGMVFSINALKECLTEKNNIIGINKRFEKILLKKNYYIEYLNEVITYTIRPKNIKYFKTKREGYKYSMFSSISSLFELPLALFNNNIDYSNKLFQWTLPPRIILILTIVIFGAIATYVDFFTGLKWWILLIFIILTFLMAIPKNIFKNKE